MSAVVRERVGALITFLFCAAAWSQIGTMPDEAAFFPRLIIGLAFLLTLGWGGSTFFGRGRQVSAEDPEGKSTPFIENPRNLLVFSLLLVVYVALIDIIGYFTSTALFILAASLGLGFRRPGVIAATMVGFVAFIYFVFVIIFQRPLPLEFFQAA